MSTVDPRPYTYEYRKPRLQNPTFRSSNMYDSLYQLRFPTTKQFVVPKEKPINTQIPQYQLQPQQSTRYNKNPQKYQLRASQPVDLPSHTRQHSVDFRDRIQPENHTRNASIIKQPMERQDSQQFNNYASRNVQSHLSNYGQTLMKSSQFDRFEVYEKQQKGFNIINCQPKELSSSLRVFPKLTLEDKLIEKGNYRKN